MSLKEPAIHLAMLAEMKDRALMAARASLISLLMGEEHELMTAVEEC